MRIDPYQEAQRLLQTVDADLYPDLADDPATVLEILIDRLVIETRPPSQPGRGCAVDASYHPGPPPRIRVADDVTVRRRRFSLLHEFGHHLIEHDDHLNDLPIADGERRDEQICNEVAAAVLLPDDAVQAHLEPGRFTAADVAGLFHDRPASRMACCVAAARRLRHPGCVILGRGDGIADFTAHHPATPWTIARAVAQGPESILAQAAGSPSGHARGVTRLRFATGNRSGPVHADANACADGWVFAVVVDDTHAPWGDGLHLGLEDRGAQAEEVECVHCGDLVEVWEKPCPHCGDRRCPRCGRCSCPVGPAEKLCPSCRLLKAPHLFKAGADTCIDCD